MESETTDTHAAPAARLQTLNAELEDLQRRSATVQEHIHTLHQEHEGLLANAMQIMADGGAGTGELAQARELLAQTRVLVQEEQRLLQEWRRLSQEQRALWNERSGKSTDAATDQHA